MTKKTPRHVVISHAYSKNNKGDAALLSVLISEVRRKFNPGKITVLTIDRTFAGETFEDVQVEHAFMYFANFRFNAKPAKFLYGVYIMSSTLLWAHAYRLLGIRLPLPTRIRKIMDIYADADLVVGVGGGYIRSQPDYASMYNLFLLAHPLYVSAALRQPAMLHAQSFGPFYHRIEKRLMRRTLNNKVGAIIIREHKSADLLRSIGVTREIHKSVDAGFLFKTDKRMHVRKRFGWDAKQLVVGITVRQWLAPDKQAAYEAAIARLADYLVKAYGAKVLFIPQVTVEFHRDDDRVVGQRILARIRHKKSVEVLLENYDHYEIKALYKELDFIVGTRFHSIIFSLTEYVPALAIEYEHKTSGIMRDLGLEEWTIKIEDVTADKLITRVDALIAHKDEYRRQLRERLPAYIDQAAHAIDIIADAYDAAQK